MSFKKAWRLAAILLFASAIFLLLPHKQATAANPTTINFQGKVVNSNGTNVANGSYTFVFRLYQNVNISTYDPNASSCASDTNCWWEETDSLTVTNGVFQVELGAGCAFSGACNSGHSGIIFDSQNALSLTMKFNGDAAGFMTPLMHLQSVPYAFNSDSLQGLSAGNFVQLAQGVQSDSSTTNPSIFVNKTGSTANILELQKSGVDVLTVNNSGSLILGKAGTSGLNGTIVFSTTNASNTSITIAAASTGTSYSLTLPTTGPSTSQCLQTDASVASQLIFGSCSGASGANTALSNLASVAINTSLLPASNDVIDLGDDTHRWANLFLGGETLHIGTNTTDEGSLAYTTSTNLLTLSNAASSSNGGVLIKNAADSTTAFQIQNAASNTILNADTTVGVITQKPFGPSYIGGVDVSSTSSGTSNKIFLSTAVNGRYLYATTGGSATDCSTTGDKSGCELQIYDVTNPSTPIFVGGGDASGSTNSGTGNQNTIQLAVSGHYAYTVTSVGDSTACSQTAGSAIGCEMKVWDISNPASPTYVGGADVSGSTNSGTGGSSNTFSGISISGRYAYLTRGADGATCSQTAGSAVGCELQVYDISNPAAPTYVGGADASGLTNSGTGNLNGDFKSVVVSGRYVYIGKKGDATDCSTVGNKIGCEIQVYDVSNPASPTFVGGADVSGSTNTGTSSLDAFTKGLTISGRYLYSDWSGNATACTQSTSGSGAIGCELKVFDISNPVSPTYVGGGDASGSTNSGTGNRNFTSPAISGRYLYIDSHADGTTCTQSTSGSGAIGCELKIWDVSSPASPTYVGGADSSGTTNSGSGSTADQSGLTISGRFIYVAHSSGDVTACSQTAGSAVGCELQVYDISGIETTSLLAHSLEAGTLQVDANGSIAGDLNIQGGLSVGQSVEVEGSFGVSGYALFKNQTNSSTAFQVQNATGSAALVVDTISINSIVSNSSFEGSTSGWAASGTGASIAATSTEKYIGSSSLDFTTGTAIGNSARLTVGTALSTSTTYTLSFYAKAGTAFSTLSASYSPDGTAANETDCAVFNPSRSVITTGWTRYYCTIDTSSTSATSSGFIAIKQSDATSRHVYIDGVQIEAGTAISQGQVGETGFESALTNWTNVGAVTAAQSSADHYNGSNDLLITDSTGIANSGAKYTTGNTNPRQLNTSSTYTLSFWAKSSSGATSSIVAGYARDGSAQTNCTVSPTSINTSSWTYFSCSITTDSTSPASTAYIFILLSSASTKTWKVDDVQLTLSTNIVTGSAFKETGLALNGVINSPTTFKNQSNSTTAFQIQNSSGSTVLGIDTVNFDMFLGNTSNSNTITIASGTTSSSYTLTLPTAAASANNYCLVSSTLGILSWVACGATGGNYTITLAPEYAGAVLTGDGGSNTGTMTSDFCSGSSLRSIPSASNPCAASEEHTYYTWVTTSQNDYDIWIRWQVPSDFSDFAASNAIKMYGWRTDNTSTTEVDLSLYNASGTLCGSTTNVATGTATWTQTTLGGTVTASACSISAGDVVDLRIQMVANNKTVRAGEISISYQRK